MEELSGYIIHHKPVSDITLKRLLLIFDRIVFIEPYENEYLIPDGVPQVNFGNLLTFDRGHVPLYKSRSQTQEQIEQFNRFSKCVDAKIFEIKSLKTSGFYESNWLPMRIAFDAETTNENIQKVYRDLLEEKPEITPGDIVLPGSMVRENIVSKVAPKLYPKIPEPTFVYDSEDEYGVGNFFDHQLYSIIAKTIKGLSITDAYNLIPITLNKSIMEGISLKITISKTNPEIEQPFEQKYNFNPALLQHLLFNISKLIVPDKALDSVSVFELVGIRENTFEKLFALRREIIKSTHELLYVEFNANSISEIEDYIERKFIPELAFYHNKHNEELAGIFKLVTPLTSAVLPCAVAFQYGMSPADIAFLSGASATIGSYISDLPQGFINKKKERFKNTFSYFFQFEG